MLVIDRVELVFVDQPLEVRKLERDHPVRRQQMRHARSEVVEIRDLRQHIVADDEIGLPSLGHKALRKLQAEEFDKRRNILLARDFRHVGRRLDAESRERQAAENAEADIRRCSRSRTPGSSRRGQAGRLIISQYRRACSTQDVEYDEKYAYSVKMCSGFTYSCSCTRKHSLQTSACKRKVGLHLIDLVGRAESFRKAETSPSRRKSLRVGRCIGGTSCAHALDRSPSHFREGRLALTLLDRR